MSEAGARVNVRFLDLPGPSSTYLHGLHPWGIYPCGPFLRWMQLSLPARALQGRGVCQGHASSTTRQSVTGNDCWNQASLTPPKLLLTLCTLPSRRGAAGRHPFHLPSKRSLCPVVYTLLFRNAHSRPEIISCIHARLSRSGRFRPVDLIHHTSSPRMRVSDAYSQAQRLL